VRYSFFQLLRNELVRALSPWHITRTIRWKLF
jgi:hypothetical protein